MERPYRIQFPGLIGIVAIWFGIASAMHTFHWIDPSFKIIRYEPYISIVCLIILLGNLLLLRPPSRRWTALRNCFLFSLGIVYPALMVMAVVKDKNSNIARFGHWKLDLLIICGIVLYSSWSYLRSKGVIRETKRYIRRKSGHDRVEMARRLVPSGGTLEYKATFDDIVGLVILCTLVGLPLIAMGILTKPPSQIAVVLGCIVILIPFAVRLRCKVTVSDGQIMSTGLFRTRTINLADITAAYWIRYPVVEIRTRDDRIRINFKFFSLECMRTVMDIIEGPLEPKSSRAQQENETKKPRRG
jgi:hypothetical protein